MKCQRLTYWIYLVFVLHAVSRLTNCQKHKRQIYREQVLPALGGKIPDEAFRTDRLALNRLNKEGITVVDGALLEAREHEKNPDNVRSKPEVIQVYVTQDSRYVPPEGRYQNDRPKTVDTTYVIRKPVVNNRDNEHQRNNEIGYVQAHRNNDKHKNDNRNGVFRNEGYRKPLEIPSQRYNPPKAHDYVNNHRFVPIVTNNRPVQSQQEFYRIYKPIVKPLVLSAPEIIFTKPHNRINDNHNKENWRPSWNLAYDWNSFYQPSSYFLEDTGDFFNSHQIITDYEGFLDTFHGRSYRHVGSSKPEYEANFSKITKQQTSRCNDFSNDRERSSNRYRDEKSNVFASIARQTSPTYTDLTSIPETSFSCAGRKGTFADVETKCQVFHECSGWSKTSSLCPAGTAYCAAKKRCEWWNTVICGHE